MDRERLRHYAIIALLSSGALFGFTRAAMHAGGYHHRYHTGCMVGAPHHAAHADTHTHAHDGCNCRGQ